MKALTTILLALLMSMGAWSHDEKEVVSLLCKFKENPTKNIFGKLEKKDITIIINKVDKTLYPSESQILGAPSLFPYVLNDSGDAFEAEKTVYLFNSSTEYGNWEFFKLNRISLELTRDWRKITSNDIDAGRNQWIKIYQCELKDLL